MATYAEAHNALAEVKDRIDSHPARDWFRSAEVAREGDGHIVLVRVSELTIDVWDAVPIEVDAVQVKVEVV